MLSLHEILLCFVLPAGVSAVVMLLGWWRSGNASPRGEWAAAVALGLGLCIGYFNLTEAHFIPSIPPASAVDWIFHIAWIVAVLGVILSLGRPRPWIAVALTMLTATIAAFLIMWPILRRSYHPHERVVLLSIVAIAAGALEWSLDRAASRVRGVTMPLILAIPTAVLAMFLVFFASFPSGFRTGVIACVLLPMVVLAVFLKPLSVARGGVFVWVVLFISLLATTLMYPYDVTPAEVVLIAVAPLLGLLPLFTPLKGWKRLTACGVVMLVPLAYVMVPATQHLIADIRADSSGEE
jgi:hypothetical protein